MKIKFSKLTLNAAEYLKIKNILEAMTDEERTQYKTAYQEYMTSYQIAKTAADKDYDLARESYARDQRMGSPQEEAGKVIERSDVEFNPPAINKNGTAYTWAVYHDISQNNVTIELEAHDFLKGALHPQTETELKRIFSEDIIQRKVTTPLTKLLETQRAYQEIVKTAKPEEQQQLKDIWAVIKRLDSPEASWNALQQLPKTRFIQALLSDPIVIEVAKQRLAEHVEAMNLVKKITEHRDRMYSSSTILKNRALGNAMSAINNTKTPEAFIQELSRGYDKATFSSTTKKLVLETITLLSKTLNKPHLITLFKIQEHIHNLQAQKESQKPWTAKEEVLDQKIAVLTALSKYATGDLSKEAFDKVKRDNPKYGEGVRSVVGTLVKAVEGRKQAEASAEVMEMTKSSAYKERHQEAAGRDENPNRFDERPY